MYVANVKLSEIIRLNAFQQSALFCYVLCMNGVPYEKATESTSEKKPRM